MARHGRCAAALSDLTRVDNGRRCRPLRPGSRLLQMPCMTALGHSRPFDFRRKSAVASKAADFAMTAKGQKTTSAQNISSATKAVASSLANIANHDAAR